MNRFMRSEHTIRRAAANLLRLQPTYETLTPRKTLPLSSTPSSCNIIQSCSFSSSSSTSTIYENLDQLGKTTSQPKSPTEAILERVSNPHPSTMYVTRFTCAEFTSLCPVTSQPDFAHIVIDYIPDKWLVESKSLKLYMTSFRNHNDFHEACSVTIGKKIVELLQPKWLRLGAYWYPRGGIPIDIFYTTGDPPKDVWIPDQGCPTYRGRG